MKYSLFLFVSILVLCLLNFSAEAKECQLGKPCHLVGSDFVYFSVIPDDGASYLCSLKSDKENNIIEVMIMPSGNFSFEGRKMSADNSPSIFEIKGKFLEPEREGGIVLKNMTSTQGIASCTAN